MDEIVEVCIELLANLCHLPCTCQTLGLSRKWMDVGTEETTPHTVTAKKSEATKLNDEVQQGEMRCRFLLGCVRVINTEILELWDVILDIFVISMPLITRSCSTGSPELRCFSKSLWRHNLWRRNLVRRWTLESDSRGGMLMPEVSSIAWEHRRPRQIHQVCDHQKRLWQKKGLQQLP